MVGSTDCCAKISFVGIKLRKSLTIASASAQGTLLAEYPPKPRFFLVFDAILRQLLHPGR